MDNQFDSVLEELEKFTARDGHFRAEIFLELPNKKDYPDYYKIIENPMSFAEIRDNAESDDYTWDDFEEDLERVWHNAELYNEETSFVVEDARYLRRQVKKILERKKEPVRIKLKNPELEIRKMPGMSRTGRPVGRPRKIVYPEEAFPGRLDSLSSATRPDTLATVRASEIAKRGAGKGKADALLEGLLLSAKGPPSFSLNLEVSELQTSQSYVVFVPSHLSSLYIAPTLPAHVTNRPHNLMVSANGRRLTALNQHSYYSRKSEAHPKSSYEVKLNPGLNMMECIVMAPSIGKDSRPDSYERERIVVWAHWRPLS